MLREMTRDVFAGRNPDTFFGFGVINEVFERPYSARTANNP